MSSPCRRASLLIIAAVALSLTACQRETRHIRSKPETGPTSQVSLSDLYPGAPPGTPVDPHAKEYEGNAYHIAQGQRYFRWFNCNGCHSNGGGGIGPALLDDQWRYGGDIDHIYATIVQGRPNGMPSFRDKIPPTQVWEIAAYVRSMTGNVDKLAAPSRNEGMSTTPLNNVNRTPPRDSNPAAVSGTTP